MWRWIGISVVVLLAVMLFVGWLNTPSETELQAQRLFGGGPVGPEVKKALDLANAVQDHHRASDIVNDVVAGKIPCGFAALNAFDAVSGKGRYWYYRWEDGTIECFSTGGFHRITRAPLLEMSTDAVRTILGNPKKYSQEADGFYSPPAPRPASAPKAPAPRPAPATTSLPDLGEGPCCSR